MTDEEFGRMVAVLHRLIEITQELKKAKPVEEITLGERDQAAEDALATLSEVTALKAELKVLTDKVVGEQVNRMRYLGATWTEVGDVLGMTAQGAFKKARANNWITEEPPQ